MKIKRNDNPIDPALMPVRHLFSIPEIEEAALKILDSVKRMKEKENPNMDSVNFYATVVDMLFYVAAMKGKLVEAMRAASLHKDMYEALLNKNELLEREMALYDPDSLLVSRNSQNFLNVKSIEFMQKLKSGELVPDGNPFFKQRWLMEQEKLEVKSEK